MKRLVILLMVIIGCLVPAEVSPQSSANYRMVGSDLNAGGSVTTASSTYKTSITFGQSSPIGVSNSASYRAQIGVQYIYHVPTTSNSYLLWTK